jgi:hypothetical protein
MNDVHHWLREGDPGVHEPAPSDAEMAELLGRVERDAVATPWTPYFFAVRRWQMVTVVAAFIAVALWAGLHQWNRAAANRNAALAAVSPEPARELYFTTPEGIRVIWIFTSPASE